jgi:hypothetical protein
MSFRLSPALDEFAKGRWPDERSEPRSWDRDTVDRQTIDPHLMEPPLHPSEREHHESEFDQFESGERWSPGRRVAGALARFLIVFCIGVTATLAWQSYSSAARRMVAGLSPQLGWLAPQPTPAASLPPAPSAAGPPDQITAITRSLSAVRQSVDKLAADITRLQAARQDPPPPVRTSGQPASAPAQAAGVARGRKPAAQVLPGPTTAR